MALQFLNNVRVFGGDAVVAEFGEQFINTEFVRYDIGGESVSDTYDILSRRFPVTWFDDVWRISKDLEAVIVISTACNDSPEVGSEHTIIYRGKTLMTWFFREFSGRSLVLH